MKIIAITVVTSLSLVFVACAQERQDLVRPPIAAPQGLDAPSAPTTEQSSVAPAPSAAAGESKSLAKPAPAALHELSPWTMFLAADPLVKAVMVSLVFASLVTWTIFLARATATRLARWGLRRSLGKIAAAGTLAEAQMMMGRTRNVLSAMVAAAIHEMRASAGLWQQTGKKEG